MAEYNFIRSTVTGTVPIEAKQRVGSGFIFIMNGTADPAPYQNLSDPEH
jgi:hypothetical protein